MIGEPPTPLRIAAVGEVLWDLFPDSVRLGGAPLNFAVHAKRLGLEPLLISAMGTDKLGEEAFRTITATGLDTRALQRTPRFATGTASVLLDPSDQPSFEIKRPAAYDAVEFLDGQIRQIQTFQPEWLYYGTLFPSGPAGKSVLDRLLGAVPEAKRFYDLNLRPGCGSPELVDELLGAADVVKLNEDEMRSVRQWTGLPPDREEFCRAGTERYGWSGVCVTLGAEGCALQIAGEYVEAAGHPVEVADTVGAGDAFAAALL